MPGSFVKKDKIAAVPMVIAPKTSPKSWNEENKTSTNPPTAAAIVFPILPKTLVKDIIVPRDWGTWSRAKQLNAEIAMAPNNTCTKLKAKAAHRLGTRKTPIKKTPSKRELTIVIRFRPNLFTIRTETYD